MPWPGASTRFGTGTHLLTFDTDTVTGTARGIISESPEYIKQPQARLAAACDLVGVAKLVWIRVIAKLSAMRLVAT